MLPLFSMFYCNTFAKTVVLQVDYKSTMKLLSPKNN
jgi:hypothetical protein